MNIEKNKIKISKVKKISIYKIIYWKFLLTTCSTFIR